MSPLADYYTTWTTVLFLSQVLCMLLVSVCDNPAILSTNFADVLVTQELLLKVMLLASLVWCN